MTPVTVVWFRRDLRTADNPALHAAHVRGQVVAVFIWSPEEEAPWGAGAASRAWLHRSLTHLADALARLGAPLVIREGPSLTVLLDVANAAGAAAVHWNRGYEPAVIARDTGIKKALAEQGLDARSFNAVLLNEPGAVKNKQGQPFKVFTPYFKHCYGLGPPARPLPAPARLEAATTPIEGTTVAQLRLRPRIAWDRGIVEAWTPGRDGALEELDAFAGEAVLDYAHERDRPDRVGVSRLSPHLHFGEISAREVWHTIAARHPGAAEDAPSDAAVPFVRQLYWREFAHQLLYHFPHTTDEPMNGNFARFPWRTDRGALEAWQRGETGYPLVDAGMRELWNTGWMHNRVRMVVASFLVKHLLIHWREGARWFWDTLVDADLANNTMGWQWSAGCGADAAPYFRIFNPVMQGERFDPNGDYVRRWVPELTGLGRDRIHRPWQAAPADLAKAGIALGRDYPSPIVDHREARARALEALKATKG